MWSGMLSIQSMPGWRFLLPLLAGTLRTSFLSPLCESIKRMRWLNCES